MTPRATRRRFLQGAAVGAGAAFSPLSAATSSASTIYASIGVRPVINGVGTVTNLGGSIMPPEVVRAMEEASKYFVPLPELQQKAGAKIADLLGVPAAMVTAGAASGITVATAACVVSGDASELRQLPDTADLKNEVIQQKTHRSGYEAQMRVVGIKIVSVETRAELDAAINSRTAMLHFLNLADPRGQIKRDEWVQVGKQRGVPTFLDAAADVPPVSNLNGYVKQGFDLVTFSGGKGLFGPQCSGLLLGRRDLIDTAQQAISPHDGIGRGMKVGKEEIMGLLAAVERYLKVDHDTERREMESKVAYIIDAVAKTGVTGKLDVPEIANHVPHALLEWDEAEKKLTSREVVKQLMEGDPAIAVSGQRGGGLRISVWLMRGDEHKIVARRLREIFAA
jgi:D-glucosaminate-6-phosphate ammonia-lyase